MSEAPAVAIRELWFAYDDVPVLEDVNVTIEELDFVGIVGPNGGGKTTLLKLMLGLLQPNRGVVRMFGERPGRVARRVGYVPQGWEYDAQFPVTVMEVVLMGRLGTGNPFAPYRRSDRSDAAEALEQVGLKGFGNRLLTTLSAGQRQRVIVARALASSPDLLMLDEPTASVDAAAEREIYDLLRDLNRTMTVIVVTHDLGFVSRAVKSVLCVNRWVVGHPTCELGEVSGELLEQMYGSDMRIVRHDQSVEGEERECWTSGRR